MCCDLRDCASSPFYSCFCGHFWLLSMATSRREQWRRQRFRQARGGMEMLRLRVLFACPLHFSQWASCTCWYLPNRISCHLMLSLLHKNIRELYLDVTLHSSTIWRTESDDGHSCAHQCPLTAPLRFSSPIPVVSYFSCI